MAEGTPAAGHLQREQVGTGASHEGQLTQGSLELGLRDAETALCCLEATVFPCQESGH